MPIFTLLRALTWSALFMGFTLVFLPGQVLARAGVTRPAAIGMSQMAGGALVVLGGALALWCILTFVFLGRGTPLPFDPPRRLVVAGPYRFVRNPMYWGAVLALLGSALFDRSLALAGYALLFLVVVDQLVRWYEEPTLRGAFGEDYERYRRDVRRWRPTRPRSTG